MVASLTKRFEVRITDSRAIIRDSNVVQPILFELDDYRLYV